MSDLPSRKRVAELGCSASSPEEAEDIESILNAYRVGRLFDREAIDYEAAFVYARGIMTARRMWQAIDAAIEVDTG